MTIPSYRSIHSIFTDHECWNQYKLQGNALMTQDSSVHQPCSIVILVYRVYYGHFIWGNTPSRSVPYCIYMYMYFPIRFLGVENQVKCWGLTVVRWSAIYLFRAVYGPVEAGHVRHERIQLLKREKMSYFSFYGSGNKNIDYKRIIIKSINNLYKRYHKIK